MYFGHIAGFTFLPVSILMFLNIFQITKLDSIFGVKLALLASIGLIIIMIGDVIDSHINDNFVVLTWIVCILLCFPAILFFLSYFVSFPAQILSSIPIIIASFLFVEGLTSFFIGG